MKNNSQNRIKKLFLFTLSLSGLFSGHAQAVMGDDSAVECANENTISYTGSYLHLGISSQNTSAKVTNLAIEPAYSSTSPIWIAGDGSTITAQKTTREKNRMGGIFGSFQFGYRQLINEGPLFLGGGAGLLVGGAKGHIPLNVSIVKANSQSNPGVHNIAMRSRLGFLTYLEGGFAFSRLATYAQVGWTCMRSSFGTDRTSLFSARAENKFFNGLLLGGGIEYAATNQDRFGILCQFHMYHEKRVKLFSSFDKTIKDPFVTAKIKPNSLTATLYYTYFLSDSPR